MEKNVLRSLPKLEVEWIRANYPDMPTALIAKRYGVSGKQISDYAYRRGWKKSAEYRKRMNHSRIMAGIETRRARGEKFCADSTVLRLRARKGKTFEEIYGEERAKEIRANMRKARHKLAVMERNRRLCGLAPLTRMGYTGLPNSTLCFAWRLRAKGYRTDYKTMTAYYSDSTDRSEFYESGGRKGRGRNGKNPNRSGFPFRFKPEPWYERELADEGSRED